MSYSDFCKLVAVIGIDKMEKFVAQYKQTKKSEGTSKRIQANINDEYDDFLRDLDRLQDYKHIQWQVGFPTWAVIGNDIVPQKTTDGGGKGK